MTKYLLLTFLGTLLNLYSLVRIGVRNKICQHKFYTKILIYIPLMVFLAKKLIWQNCRTKRPLDLSSYVNLGIEFGHLIILNHITFFIHSDRFAEQVNPLLIQAQRKLINRIEDYGGHMPPQLHFQVAMQNDKQLMTAKQYTIKQLNVQLDKDNISEIDPGAQIDPEGHDAYGGTGSMSYF